MIDTTSGPILHVRNTRRNNMLDADTVTRLTREAKPKDFKMLVSYVKHCVSERHARETIQTLRTTHADIWVRRVTP